MVATSATSAAAMGCRPSRRIALNLSGDCQHPPDLIRAEPGPLVKHPLAADGGGLKANDQTGRVVGVINLAGPGGTVGTKTAIELGGAVELRRPTGVPEQPPAEVHDLLVLAPGDVFDARGEPGSLGAIGAIELPRHTSGPLEQSALDHAAGPEVGRPLVHPLLKLLRIFIWQDVGPRGEPVLYGIEARAILAFRTSGPGAFFSITAIRFDFRLTDHRISDYLQNPGIQAIQRSEMRHGSEAGYSPGVAGVDARKATPPDLRPRRRRSFSEDRLKNSVIAEPREYDREPPCIPPS